MAHGTAGGAHRAAGGGHTELSEGLDLPSPRESSGAVRAHLKSLRALILHEILRTLLRLLGPLLQEHGVAALCSSR